MLKNRSKRPRPARLCLLIAGLCLGSARADTTAFAPEAPPDAPAATPAPNPIPVERRSPRAVLRSFFERMRADEKRSAAELLDLSQVSAVAAEKRRPDLAYKLYRLIRNVGNPPVRASAGGEKDLPEIVTDPQAEAPGFEGSDSTSEYDFENVPSKDSERQKPWPLDQWLIDPSPEAAQLKIARQEDGGWRFSAETVGQIDALYERVTTRLEDSPAGQARAMLAANGDPEPTATTEEVLRQAFPKWLQTTHFLIPTYQWILLGCLVPIGRVIEKATCLLLTPIGDFFLGRIDPEFIEAHQTTAKVWRPVGRLANATAWVVGADWIGLPIAVMSVLSVVLRVIAVVAAVLAVYRVLDLVAGYFLRRAKRRDRKSDDLVIPLATSTAKIVATLAGVVAAVASLSDELPATLIGGLGIGGIAIALASQETLSNFFGSITLLFDRPFEVGDWVNIEGVEGEVERLGFRSTQIRTGINSQVTVPNSKLAGANVDNLGRRKYRRYLNKLGLEYGTPPERIEAFCEGVRELIRRHPHTRKDFYAAYFNDFGPASLDVLVVVYFEVPDWATELRERHRLLADIARLAESLGVAFAFPTQTLHLHRGESAAAPEAIGEEEGADLLGARKAAEIAGELANYQDRPGRVKFPGPTQLD
ncbi:Low conductance mechanosensitive channel YnaI [Planctomycetes bacterium MalM25]|nr:Low conductance mechanosensitive channel YnaI [Planctomycetes bacterium MalM25]